MKVLLTGGAGYIGSHTAVELLNGGYSVVVADNLSNSNKRVLDAVNSITNKKVTFHAVDICNIIELREVFQKEKPDAVIHFAALKSVSESVKKPLDYYRINVEGAINLLAVMKEYGVQKLVFSSSATVYGSAPYPYEESMQTGVGVTSPYGKTKVVVENLLQDLASSDSTTEFIALRYFNPVGAHESGAIGEQPQGIPNNLMPYIAQVASGKREKLSIFGNDYPTQDGTCVRDYIHVVDVAKGHVAALEHFANGFDAVNLGSGKGTSVLELVHAFEQTCGVSIPYEIAPRRPGDLPEFYANPAKADMLWGWHTTLSIEDMCRDTWRWQQHAS